MAVTSGFFNSVNGDRKYNAEQMSAIFDGIINDGILANIGTAFSVTANEGNTVNVGIGRAWFNSTWIYNDAILPVVMDDSELVLDRIDAVIIEVDRTDEVRAGAIKVVKGEPSSSPQNPTMEATTYVHQYPLAYIFRKAGSASITQGNITSMIGTSSTPYVTGILQVQNIDNIVAQWQAQWIEWFASETAQTEEEAQAIIDKWAQWYADQTSQSSSQMSQWMAQMQSDFNIWLASLKDAIGDEPAASLAAEIVGLQNKFDTLMRDKCIYDRIEDSTGQSITDSDGLEIEGKSVFGTEGDLGNNSDVPIDNSRLISTYSHVKIGTVHHFYGRGENGRAKITDDFVNGDTFAVNDVPVPAYAGADSASGDTIVKGRWVTFIFDGNELNFKGGGGKVTVSNLSAASIKTGTTVTVKQGTKTVQSVTGTFTADANAVAGDILSGKTAYVKGIKVNGNIPSRERSTQAVGCGYNTNRLFMVLNYGYYPAGTSFDHANTSQIYLPEATVANTIGLTAAKLLSGNTILGISGTAEDLISGLKSAFSRVGGGGTSINVTNRKTYLVWSSWNSANWNQTMLNSGVSGGTLLSWWSSTGSMQGVGSYWVQLAVIRATSRTLSFESSGNGLYYTKLD